MKYKILFIGGSLNQTTMMHQISKHFDDCDCFFSPYYDDGVIGYGARIGLLNFTILAGKFKEQTENYLKRHRLTIDYKGQSHNYDLVFTCQDLIIPRNIRNKKVVLVQEGMTEPENFTYHMVKTLRLPRWLAGTSTTGMSNAYDLFFVASQGYKELFVSKGADPSKIHVTGIPNFDHATQFFSNNLPCHNFVLAATSDRRETFNYENRKKFIQKVLNIAAGRQVIFKLHPNEKLDRAICEIQKYAPDALVLTDVNINHLIANCDVLVTKHSSVVYIGMALGKEVYSDFSMDFLRKLTPIQNEGTSAQKIAKISKLVLLPNKKLHSIEIESNYKQVAKYALI